MILALAFVLVVLVTALGLAVAPAAGPRSRVLVPVARRVRPREAKVRRSALLQQMVLRTDTDSQANCATGCSRTALTDSQDLNPSPRSAD
jgi:hypothetical protein